MKMLENHKVGWHPDLYAQQCQFCLSRFLRAVRPREYNFAIRAASADTYGPGNYSERLALYDGFLLHCFVYEQGGVENQRVLRTTPAPGKDLETYMFLHDQADLGVLTAVVLGQLPSLA
jgi:hypothetical protein